MEEFVKKRLEICSKCAIVRNDPELGPQCDGRKWLNPETNEMSFFKKDGWIRGCSCYLKFKTRGLTNHCPANRW